MISASPTPTIAWSLFLQRLGLSFLFFLLLALYYPALSLPPSLIDDHVIARNSENLVNNWKDKGFVEALKQDISIQQRTFNSGYWLLGAAQHRIFGGQPFHWWRLLELGIVISLLFHLVTKIGGGRWPWLGAVLGGSMLLMGEMPASIDFQSLRANWFRLYASDATALPWLLLHITTLWLFIAGSSRWRWCWLALSWIALQVSFSIKIPMIVAIAPSFLMVIAAFFLKERRLALHLLVYGAACALAFLGYNSFVRSLAPPATEHTYTSSYKFSVAALIEGFRHYAWCYGQMLGPLAVIVPAASVAAAWRLSRFPDRHSRIQAMLLIYLLACWACFTLIYTPWPSRLPRYMLSGYASFCLLSGVLLNTAIILLKQNPLRWHYASGFFVLGIGLAILSPVIFSLVIVALAAAWAIKGSTRFIFIFAGAGAVALCFFCFSSYLGCRALNRFYVTREHLNIEAVRMMNRQAVQGRNLWFAGDRGDEHIGSLAGMMRRSGVDTPVHGINQPPPARPRAILVHHLLSPEEWRNTPAGYNLVQELTLPEPSIPVSFGYWQLRQRLLKREEPLLHSTWTYSFHWRLLE